MSSPSIPLGRVILRAAVVSALLSGAGYFLTLHVLGLLATLFSVGFLAGAWGRRQGWLSGIIVAFPFSFLQVTRMAAIDLGGSLLSHPDYWRLAVPAAMVAGAMGVIGSMTGAWLGDMKLQKDA
jgi:hypothetical protein